MGRQLMKCHAGATVAVPGATRVFTEAFRVILHVTSDLKGDLLRHGIHG